MHHPTERITQTMAFVTHVVEQWMKIEIAEWVHDEGSIQRLIIIYRDYYQSVFGYRQYHVLGIRGSHNTLFFIPNT